MNAVIGMTGLLLDTDLRGPQRQLAETVRDSGEALLAIINDILDFSKIESGELELEDTLFDLQECLDSALSLVALPAQAKGLELVGRLDPACPTFLRGDVTRLRQVVVNLLSNAVKFTERGEIVVEVTGRRVAAASTDPDGTGPVELRIAVRDTGIGIPADRIDRLFREFSQVDASTTRVYGGTGLGLAISRRLARALGGDLRVSSAVGVGTTFTLTVRMTACTDRRAAAGVPVPGLADRSVLIVDASPTSRQVLAAQLTSWGLRCTEAESADAALTALADRPYDAALVDLRLPGTDGVTLARRIRELPSGRELPLTLLTGAIGHPEASRTGLFRAMLAKPLRPSVVRATLDQLFDESGAGGAGRGRRATDAAPAPLAARRLRVLLAEDNPINQQVAQLIVEKLGHRIDTVGNGQEAVEALARTHYDAVLMDIQMPVLDGLEATRRIRAALPAERQPHIIAMTASVLVEDQAACRAAGMDSYLPKPVRAADLAAALAAVSTHGTGTTTPPTPTYAQTPTDEDIVDDDSIDRQNLADMRARADDLLEPDADDAERAMVARLFASFVQRLPGALAAVEACYAAGDDAELTAAAHSLKGMASNIGALRLSRVGAAVEDGARADAPPPADTVLPRLHHEAERAARLADRLAAEFAPAPSAAA